jgi:hypothetical protein
LTGFCAGIGEAQIRKTNMKKKTVTLTRFPLIPSAPEGGIKIFISYSRDENKGRENRRKN